MQSYWYVAFRDFGDYCDVFGNLLTILFNVANPAQERRIMNYLDQVGIDEEWEFNEWCHGRTGRPMGYPHQAWSAGMYVFAHHCVTTESLPFLG